MMMFQQDQKTWNTIPESDNEQWNSVVKQWIEANNNNW